jgi:hypothetical protein
VGGTTVGAEGILGRLERGESQGEFVDSAGAEPLRTGERITTVESAEYVAGLIRKALEYIPPERLVITTDCSFGREGLSRRIA